MYSAFDRWAYLSHMLTAISMFSPCTQWVFGPLSPVTDNWCDDRSDTLDGELNEDWITELDTVSRVCGPSHRTVDLFTAADALIARTSSEDSTRIVRPLRTFSTSWAAFNLNRQPDIAQISVDSLAEKYNLPDLHPALLDFFYKQQSASVYHIGGQ